MPGTFPVASKILHKYEQDRAYRLHRQKVSTIKPKVATKGPRKYPHLILSLKKIQLEEEKQAEVDHENRLLLHKMTNIMKNRAQVDNWNEYEPRSLNYIARERHIRDIQSENIGIAKRLEKAQPVIKADDLEKDYQHKRYLQTLWNENAKDYEEVTPRHHRFKELKRSKDGIEGEDDYDNDFEDDDSKSKKREKLPPLTEDRTSKSIKYSYNPYTNKTSSSNDSLPRIDSKKTEREKLFMYYGDAPPDDKKQIRLPVVSKKSVYQNKNHGASKLTASESRLRSVNIKSDGPFSYSGEVPLHKDTDDVIEIPAADRVKTAESSLSAITEAEFVDPLLFHKSHSSCQNEQISNVKPSSATYENVQNDCQQHSSLQNHKTVADGMKKKEKTDSNISSSKPVNDFVDVTSVSVNQHTFLDNGGINPYQVKMSKMESDENISVDKQGEIQNTSSLTDCIPNKGIGDGMNCMFSNGTQSSTNTTSCDQHEGDGTTPTGPNCTNNIQARSTVFGICTDDDEVSPTNPTDNDCKQLFKVAKQLAAPPDILIKTLVKKTPKQRQQTKERFKEMYDLELVSELKEGLGPEWHPLIDALLNDSTSSGAKKLHDALEEGDYSQTVEILCSSNKSAMADLKESYKKEYAVSLESDIKDKTDDPEQALLLILQKGLKEDSGKVDEKTAGKDAEQLNETGEGRWSSSSGKFLKLLSTKSLAHLRVVLNLYTVETGGRDATDDIKKECSKNYADAVVTLLQQVRGAETHYADQLFKNMGPTNPVFIDILVNKNEGDMAAIRKEYKKKYDAELPDDVKHKCKGHPTEKVMVELAGKSKGGKGQKKGSTTAAPPPSKKPGAKKPAEKGSQKGQEGEQKKDNPLSKPTPRVTADAAQQKKDKEKNAEKEKKQKEEEQKNKNGTVQASAHSDPEEDCLALYDAMKGLGTDEDAIIEIIPHRSNSQRQTLKKKYKEKYKKDLASELQSELTGDFEEIILALMMTPVEYDAYCLHEAMDGMGTTESTLIGIICTRNAKEKQAIKEQYKKAYKKDLEKDVIGDTSGGFTDLLLELLKGEREQGTSVNQKQAQDDAKKLSGNGKEKKIDLNSKEFMEIMTKRNKAQLRATFDEYKKLMGHDIYQGIANSMSGDAEDAYIGLVTVVEDPVGFYADRLSRAFSGVGTNDSMLIRIVVSRSEIDLAEIKVKYKELSGKTLRSSIESECSGDYKKILLEIVGE
ncbi:Annexin A7,Putative annexin A2-like protein,Annexin-B12,Annexin A6,Annexin A1,Annexin A11,Annexin A8,Annexin A2,Annexin A3,Annexin B10,Annexin A8-like protein 1,Annexin A5,Annexin A13,Annexin A2-A,Annexin A4 [Mytilus coruscus]|uniref:Annexin n=1 Tax=Mytilus coruscus TaxID=42192 RepID=A0A6J8C588_MYTCO|nr:Annexin A7,Putative annexin A2-like protein,Annexin-B12,Annexin A6,Annexin A1,Annexin A11,Annexin A8,Annexin A2,Annexin A3,Annexin B10,Annexin A8-like protein 1,Annexin A5,Annexin A13,Annexin A2-A,Annexin A4 [Mytilus coruscus]